MENLYYLTDEQRAKLQAEEKMNMTRFIRPWKLSKCRPSQEKTVAIKILKDGCKELGLELPKDFMDINLQDVVKELYRQFEKTEKEWYWFRNYILADLEMIFL